MKKEHRTVLITLMGLAIIIAFMVVGLPYSKFSWVEAISDYGGDITKDDEEAEPDTPPLSPITDVDPAENPPTFVELPVSPDTTPAVTLFAPVIETHQVGNASVIARGVILSVDYFALTPDGVSSTAPFEVAPKVCLQGNGVLVFLAADQAPRVPVDLVPVPSSVPGYTCALIDRPGTLVLVEG